MLKTTALRASGILAIALLLPVTAAAQAGGEVRRPYRGLFGGDPNDATVSSLQVALSGAYDDNVLPQQGNGPVDPRFQKKGYLGGGNASLTLQRNGKRLALGVQATTSFRYYADQGEVMSESHGLFANAIVRPWARTSVSVAGGVAYSPMYSAMLSPTGAEGEVGLDTPGMVTSSGDYAVSFRPAIMTQGTAQISHALTRRMSMSAGYALHMVEYVDEDRQQQRHSASADASYRITRYASLRVGYALAEYQLGPSLTRNFHDVQGGIDYSRPLSLSGRRTTFTITPGWTLVERQGRLQLAAAGTVSVNHEIGRTWAARAFYQRGIRFIDGVETEMLADSFTTQVGGLVTRRLQLTFGGQVVLGEQASVAREYQSYAGVARLNFALTRNIAAYAQYIHFHYRFGDALTLPDNVAGQMDRRGVRVGITLWTPILR